MFKFALLVAALTATAVSAGPNAAGLAFLKENAEKEGVISLPSGVQYKVLRKGTGNFHPTVDS
jgi:FKBP-type peptidyl-prolyl cis-trans isomerase